MLNKIKSFFVFIVMLAGSPLAAQNAFPQNEIDAAYALIMNTHLGQAVCRQILGGDVQAIQHHLGVSQGAAASIAANCPRAARHAWIYATRPEDIRKLTLSGSSPRKYKVFTSDISFPLESWTEPFTNTTVIITPSLPIKPERWVRILAHEMGVYFDSKANPAHPDAGHIPSLRQLNIQSTGPLDPLVTLSNPLHSHALTFVRALQVEHEILKELASTLKLDPAKPLLEPGYEALVGGQCEHECLKSLVLKIRSTLLPISLPLLAFAPHYRSLILQELPNMRLHWADTTWQKAQKALNHLPVEFLKSQSAGDPVPDMYSVFFANQSPTYQEVKAFLDQDLWPLEKLSLFTATVDGKTTLLEFMKKPTLSGYNVGLSSGPRVRIRTGNVE